MAELSLTALHHSFGPKGSDGVQVAVVDCGNCERQCGFTGLYVKGAVVDGNKNLVGGEAATRLYETDTPEAFETTELDAMKEYALSLGSIQGEVPLDGLTDFTLETVSNYLKAGHCLVDLAQSQTETAAL